MMPSTPFAIAVALALLLAGCAADVGPPSDPLPPGDPPPAHDPGADGPDLSDPALAHLGLVMVADGFASPLGVTHAGDGSGRLFVVERGGTVRVVQGGVVQEAAYLDVGDLLAPLRGENGLLGLAFHPDFAATGRVFVHYVDVAERNVVAELQVDDPAADVVDTRTLRPLLDAESASTIHQGGQIAFGPDGYLYLALGDGGDPDTAQDLATLHGSIVRIDVDAAEGAGAPPADNPFVDVAEARPEIWAYGLRNPWRFSFDPATGDLWIADVGQNAVEEVNLQPAGDAGGHNYGWPIMEGDRCYEPPEGCDTSGLTLPALTYDHADGWGRAVIGGTVYRGEAIAALRGAYVFGDYVSGDIFAAAEESAGWQASPLLETPYALASFGLDEAGEIHLVDFAAGGLYRLSLEVP
jgi:glucose/arabinose dehydrogenase